MSHIALLMMLRRYRWVYLFVFAVAVIVAFFMLIPEVMKYESSTTFYNINEGMDSPANYSQKDSKVIYLQDPIQERLYQLTYSTELLEHLIDEFDLYKYYNIDTAGIYHHERIINELVSNIEFKRNTPDLFTIIVYDRDPEIAAKIANAIVAKLDEINREYLISKLQANLEFYESFLTESEKMSEDQDRRILFYSEKMKNNSGKDKITTPNTEFENSLDQSATSIREVTTQLILAKALYSKAIRARQSNESPSLKVVKKAIPDPESKMMLVSVLALLSGILTCSIVIIVMYFLHAYSKELQIVFGRVPNSE